MRDHYPSTARICRTATASEPRAFGGLSNEVSDASGDEYNESPGVSTRLAAVYLNTIQAGTKRAKYADL